MIAAVALVTAGTVVGEGAGVVTKAVYEAGAGATAGAANMGSEAGAGAAGMRAAVCGKNGRSLRS